jgi:virulence-associated protein VagC
MQITKVFKSGNSQAFHLLAQLPDDFMIDRSDEPAQERSDL